MELNFVPFIIVCEFLIITLLSIKYINWNQLNKNNIMKNFFYYVFIFASFLILSVCLPISSIHKPYTNLIFLSYINYLLVYTYTIINLIIYYYNYHNLDQTTLNIIR